MSERNQEAEANAIARDADRDQVRKNRQLASLDAQLDHGSNHADRQETSRDDRAAPAGNDHDQAESKPARSPFPDGFQDRFYTRDSRSEITVYADSRGERELFRDSGDKMRTSDHSELAVKAMIETARHRDWGSIKVTGTRDFKREVWLEGQSRGIEVKGYKPNELDRQELENRQRAQALNTMEKDGRQTDTASHERGQSRAGVPEQREPEKTAEKDAAEIKKRQAVEKVMERDLRKQYPDDPARVQKGMETLRKNLDAREARGEKLPDMTATKTTERSVDPREQAAADLQRNVKQHEQNRDREQSR